MDNLTPFIRIALRVGGGFLVGKGWADETVVEIFYEDPLLIGSIAIGIAEIWYWFARRFKRAT